MNRLRQFGRHLIIRKSFPLRVILLYLVIVPIVIFVWRLLRGGSVTEAMVSLAFVLFLNATIFGTLEAVLRYKNRPRTSN